MSNFVIICPSAKGQQEGQGLFQRSLECARKLKGQSPCGVVENGWTCAATFGRVNGLGEAPVVDPRTGSWLLAVGSWFHNWGFRFGAESRLLERYMEVGAHQLSTELQGFYVIAIGDGRSKEVVVITDVVGSCHAFYRSWDQMFIVSGSSLLLAGLKDVSLNTIGSWEFLSTGVMYEDRTFYNEVHKIGPATIVTIAEGIIQRKQKYWSVKDIEPDSLDGNAAVEELWSELTGAVRAVGAAFARPVCDLTGGFDSRAVVAACCASGIKCSVTVSGPDESSDVIVSKGLAKLLGLSHVQIAPACNVSSSDLETALQLTDGEYNLLEYANILRVHRHLMGQYEASINGSFGEVARGYWWEVLFPRVGKREKLDSTILARKRYATEQHDVLLVQGDEENLVAHMAGVVERSNVDVGSFPNTVQMDNAYLAMRMQRWQGRIASSTDQLWPCISPFMFKRVLEVMLRVKAGLRKRSLLIRSMLARFQPRIAEFPLEHGYPALPFKWSYSYRFWPLPVHYAHRLLNKAGIVAATTPVLNGTGPTPVRLQLWEEYKVADLLDPKKMKSAVLFNETAFERFLAMSRRSEFAKNELWARVLSLEWVWRAIGESRR